jgi:hypothetical protein
MHSQPHPAYTRVPIFDSYTDADAGSMLMSSHQNADGETSDEEAQSNTERFLAGHIIPVRCVFILNHQTTNAREWPCGYQPPKAPSP